LEQPLNSAIREVFEERVRFYRDLGLTEFYRRPVNAALAARLASEPEVTSAPDQESGDPSSRQPPRDRQQAPEAQSAIAPDLVSGTWNSTYAPAESQAEAQKEQQIPPRKPIPSPPPVTSAPLEVADRAAALQQIRDEIGDCTRCPLHQGRNKLVFGDGSPTARLMFVGEGPGADEDAQGLPFVGKAGQLLNNMIAAMGLKREEVYIANVVKCRPPGNRVPTPEEGATCSPFLFRQIDVVRPQVLVALGATAATWLLGARQPLAGLRGRVHAYRGARLIVTYHPAYLLRDPRQKKEAWADLQIAMRELGLKPPGR
jgi:DNA polymerase